MMKFSKMLFIAAFACICGPVMGLQLNRAAIKGAANGSTSPDLENGRWGTSAPSTTNDTTTSSQLQEFKDGLMLCGAGSAFLIIIYVLAVLYVKFSQWAETWNNEETIPPTIDEINQIVRENAQLLQAIAAQLGVDPDAGDA